MAVVGKTLVDLQRALDQTAEELPGRAAELAGYELVMVTSEDARYVVVLRVEVDHEQRKVYLHG